MDEFQVTDKYQKAMSHPDFGDYVLETSAFIAASARGDKNKSQFHKDQAFRLSLRISCEVGVDRWTFINLFLLLTESPVAGITEPEKLPVPFREFVRQYIAFGNGERARQIRHNGADESEMILSGKTGSTQRTVPRRSQKPLKADRLIRRIELWTPIRLREELLGDIREDVKCRRDEGCSEKDLCELIYWQFKWALAGWLWSRLERLIMLVRAGK